MKLVRIIYQGEIVAECRAERAGAILAFMREYNLADMLEYILKTRPRMDPVSVEVSGDWE